MEQVWEYVGITPALAASTVIATAVIYGVLVLLLETLGQRLYATPSTVEIALVAMLGSVVGRTTLGPYPTLGCGIVALLTLVTLEMTIGAVRRHPRVSSRGRRYRAVSVMVNGRWRADVLHQFALSRRTLWGTLRSRGISDPADVALMVMESNGHFSVIRRGVTIHPDALSGLRDREWVAEQLGMPPE